MSARPRNVVRVALVLGLLLVVGAAFVRPMRDADRARHGITRAAPPAELPPTPSGFVPVDAARLLARVRASKARGVLVSVWASWCGSCRQELPMLLRLEEKFGDRIGLFLVSADEPSGEPAARKMLDDYGAKGPRYVVSGSIGDFKTAIDPRWPGMLPATFLFDTTGKLRYFWGGPVFENEITPLLERYLSGEHIDGEADFALAPGAVTGP
jgi:thiol-disulfide isomerase/thioredoxin